MKKHWLLHLLPDQDLKERYNIKRIPGIAGDFCTRIRRIKIFSEFFNCTKD